MSGRGRSSGGRGRGGRGRGGGGGRGRGRGGRSRNNNNNKRSSAGRGGGGGGGTVPMDVENDTTTTTIPASGFDNSSMSTKQPSMMQTTTNNNNGGDEKKKHITNHKFAELQISTESRRALSNIFKYEYMTTVQAETLPLILSEGGNKDCLAKAKTGTGAFFLSSSLCCYLFFLQYCMFGLVGLAFSIYL